MRRSLASLVGLLLLAGCADRLAEHRAALARSVGTSEAEVVRIFGAPTRTFESRGHTFLAYDEQYMVALPPEPVALPFRGWWLGAEQPAAAELPCETTIEIAGGKAVSWSLHGEGCG